jgi:sulfide dehydrogenase cytochrome subunit
MQKKKGFPALTLALLSFLPLTSATSGPSAEALSLPCTGCHGPGGVSHGAGIPSIAGLNADYLLQTMLQFKQGRRTATIMDRIAKGYKDYELRKIAGWFASRGWRTLPVVADGTLVARGHSLHREHCEECHEDLGRYQDREVPRIAGQRPDYLHAQLRLYYNEAAGLPQPSKMAERMTLLTEPDLRALSAFYSTVD